MQVKTGEYQVIPCYPAIQIDSRLLPDKESAVHDFEENGGHLTTFSVFGEDPLEGSTYLFAQREMEFHRRYPDFRNFFIQWQMVTLFYFVKESYI